MTQESYLEALQRERNTHWDVLYVLARCSGRDRKEDDLNYALWMRSFGALSALDDAMGIYIKTVRGEILERQ